VTPQIPRHIHTTPKSREIPDLLQAIFVAEMMWPSKCIWIVSPWVSDIPIIDNSAGGFSALEPDWPKAWIRLSQLIKFLVMKGSTIRIATRPVEHNLSFIEAIKNIGSHRVQVAKAEDLHEKGILGDTFYLSGSMNFTFNGISVYEEAVTFSRDSQIVAENRIQMQARWGGPIRE
jgi:hypothetical protein